MTQIPENLGVHEVAPHPDQSNELPRNEFCPICMERRAVEAHHIVRRSLLGGAYDWVLTLNQHKVRNVVWLCRPCHRDVTENRLRFVYDRRSHEFIPPELTEGEGSAIVDRHIPGEKPGEPSTSPSVSPGQDCPTCRRRVPYPRKKTSPKSKVFAFRVPADEHDEFAELLDAAAEHWGVKDKPHHRYRLVLDALVLLLQTESKEAA